jgi:hypothetical protein
MPKQVHDRVKQTTTWTFMRPDRLTDEQFQEQLKGFDIEVHNWEKYLATDCDCGGSVCTAN